MRSLLLNHLLFFPYFAKPVACELRSFCSVLAEMQQQGKVVKTPNGYQLVSAAAGVSLSRSLYRDREAETKLLSFSPHLLTLLRRRPQTTRPFNVRYRPLCITDHRDKYVRELLDK